MGQASRAVAVWLLVFGAVVVSLGAARLRGVPPTPEEMTPVTVRLAATRDLDTVAYTFTLNNDSDGELREVYIAGKVPPGADFAGVGATPAGSWFRGYEGTGTPLQAAVWLAAAIPPHTSLGPFTYRITAKGDPSQAPGQVWVHWQGPDEGTALSPQVAP